jgi:hypothetical protein
MILFLKRSFSFSIVVLLVFIIMNLFQSYYNIEPEHYKKQYESITNYKNDYEGIIIGTSHATHSIRPSILDKSGIRFYNYSLNGSNPEFYFKWYTTFIKNVEIKPKFCLFSIDFFMFDQVLLKRRIEKDSEYFPKKLFFNQLINNKNLNKFDFIINRFPVIKYRSQIKESLLLLKGNEMFNINNYDRGYISCSIPFDKNLFKPELNFQIDTTQVKYFKLLLKQMLDDNIKIILVMVPEYGIKVNQYDQMKSMKIIDSIKDQFNLPIINYNTELRSILNQNITYFADWGHMNHKGAKMFSRKLAKEIKDRF